MGANPYRTVVDSEAESRALVDAATVFSELGVTPTSDQTTQMETVIGQASALIDTFLDRVLAEEDVTDHFRMPCGEVLRLSRYPVAEVLEVIEAGTALTPDDWELDGESGQLWRIANGDRFSWSDAGTTTVSYVGGYRLPEDLPADIQRAAVDQAKAKFMSGGRDPTVRSFNVPEVYAASYSTGGGENFGKSGLLAEVEGALERRRRITV